jgi:hypothetical protein
MDNIFKIKKVKTYNKNDFCFELWIELDKECFNQNVLFAIMNTCFNHRVLCSIPDFKDIEDKFLFLKLYMVKMRKKPKRISAFLTDIIQSLNDISGQFNFENVDLSMCVGIDLNTFVPEYLTAIKDQYFNGSWPLFLDDLKTKGNINQADVVKKLILFEEKNNKNLSICSGLLYKTLDNLERLMYINGDKN